MVDQLILALLPSLIALVETESVTGAARRVGVSQPRMSARLAELRSVLGDPILVPAGRRRGSVATIRAIEWARRASGSLEDLKATFSASSFDAGSAKHTFQIMANESATLMVCAPLMKALRHVGTGLRLVLHGFDKSRLHGVESGDLDLLLGRQHQFRGMSSLVKEDIIEDCFATIQSINEGGEALDLDAFCARDHVLISTNPARRHGKVDEALAELGRRRNVVASVETHLQAIEIVSYSDLIATVPSRLALGRSAQISATTPPLIFDPFTITAAWHPRRIGDPAHRWLREQIVSVTAAHSISGPDL